MSVEKRKDKVDWIVYYDDGSSFSADDGPPESAPATGVQIIAEADDCVGRRLQSGKDFYLRRKGEWIGVDLIGLIDHLTNSGQVKLGRMLTRKEFETVLAIAKTDERLPRKSARYPDERT